MPTFVVSSSGRRSATRSAIARANADLLVVGLRPQRRADVVDIRARYLPTWTKTIIHVPFLREVVTWNLLAGAAQAVRRGRLPSQR